MCRMAIIPKDFKDEKFLVELFTLLDNSAGKDGLGIGWFEGGISHIFKGEKITSEQMAKKVCEINSDHGILFHCRRASIGDVNDENCQPFIWKNTVVAHNGQMEGTGVLKLMMLENLDKYQLDGWTIDNISRTSDTNILAYFISKRGFGIASMMDCGTVITMYPNEIRMYVGHCLEAIQRGSDWIYASEFSDKMGLAAEQWLVFGKGTDITVTGDNCVLNAGYYVDGKELLEIKKKKKKGKHRDIMVV